jgi:hypothetical protein
MTLSTASDTYSIRYKVLIGPKWERDDSATFYDWSALTLGTSAPSPINRILTIDLEPGADSVTIDSGGFPGVGGIWVAGNAAGETWEYVTYTGGSGYTLTGVTRETVGAEQTGHHTAGAAIKFLWELVDVIGPLEVTEVAGDTLASRSWTATLVGVNCPRVAVRNGHLCVVQADQYAAGAWSGFKTILIGWLTDPRISDDETMMARYDLKIASSAQLLSWIETPGVQVGDSNAAIQADVLTSSDLGQPYKELGSGEFTSSVADLSGPSAVDGKIATLWMSDWFVGGTNNPADTDGTHSRHMMDQIHIAPYAGQPAAGYRWIQMEAGPTSQQVGWGVKLINKDGYYPTWWTHDDFSGMVWNVPHPFNTPEGTPVIFVESKILFRLENPNLGPCELVEISNAPTADFGCFWRSEPNFGPGDAYTALDWWNSFVPEGGGLCVLVSSGGSLNNVGGNVVWGNTTLASCQWHGDWKHWSGATLAAVPAGQTIRRIWGDSGYGASGWIIGRASTPGYFMNGTQNQWILLKTVGLELRLRDALDASQTDNIYITGGAGDTLDGLDASGTIQVGSEQIHYTAKDEINKKLDGTVTRAYGGTVGAEHPADDMVRVISGGVAVDAWPAKSVSVDRLAGKPAPHDFNLYAGRNDSARTPPDGLGWNDDYTLLETVVGNNLDTYPHVVSPASRYRNYLVHVTAMEVDPYRVCINELNIAGDNSVYSSTNNIPASSVTTIAATIAALAGLPDGAVIDGGGTPTIDDITTDSAKAWVVLNDLADMTSCLISAGFDSKLTVCHDPYRDLPTPIVSLPGTLPQTGTEAWSRLTVRGLDYEQRSGYETSQIKLTWRNLDNTVSDQIVRYPSEADGMGSVSEIGPYICADSTAALVLAKYKYLQARHPFIATAEAANYAWDRHPLDICTLLWQIGSDTLPIDRYHRIQRGVHRFDKEGLASVFVLEQQGREDGS